MFGGHDYDPQYQQVRHPQYQQVRPSTITHRMRPPIHTSLHEQVTAAVDRFVEQHNLELELHIIGPASQSNEPLAFNDCCPSWFVVKP